MTHWVLGPILFVLYTVDLIPLIESHGLSAPLYADDTEVYGSFRPADVASFSTILSRCVDATSDWMKSNRLQSNPDKVEIMWCATSRRQHQLPTTALSIDGAAVDPVKSVRDLGIYIDADLVMRTHVHGQYRDVTPHSVNYARFAVPYHHQRSSHWLSPWCFPGWTMEMLYWSAYRPT